MKVLLINPNRYKAPPVPPLGLEYVSGSLEEKGHAVEIVDLCFSENLYKDLDDAIESFRPDVTGITVRNVDTVLYHTNEFFLDEIRNIITYIKTNCGLRVIAGGTGVASNPGGILKYLGADFIVAGPAESTICEVLDKLQTHVDGRVFYGILSGKGTCPRATDKIDYGRYRDAGGILGFQTHKGCSSSCVYCLEANSRVSFRNIPDVIREIKGFVDSGFDHFHLCDSEFNESLEYATDFCDALKKSGIRIRWAVYMKPSNFNRQLFRLLKDIGVYLITLSVDSWKKCEQYWSDFEKFIFGVKAHEIGIAVDFLTGFPYEKKEEILQYLDILRRPLPDSVGINTYIRLYQSLQVTNIIRSDPKLGDHLSGCTDDDTLLKPVFYNHIHTDALKEMIDGDPLFRIEGPEKGVNYTRIKAVKSKR
jgi:tRNA A37 methylthiotransferase MiaB